MSLRAERSEAQQSQPLAIASFRYRFIRNDSYHPDLILLTSQSSKQSEINLKKIS